MYDPIALALASGSVANANRQPPPLQEDEYLQSMNPIDALKRTAELRNRYEVPPEKAAKNLAQTLTDVAYVTPVLGNILSARDAYRFGKDAASNPSPHEARKSMAMANLSALGAILGLPFGNIAKSATAGAKDSARIFAGPTAKTADHAALTKAQELTKSGASRDEVWNQTGWYRGNDGKWRFEIDDSGASLKGVEPPKSERHAATFSGLSHPEYEAAYGDYLPKNISGVFDPRMRTQGQYSPHYDEIFAQGPSQQAAKGTTLHELQHHTQELEGFAKGSNPGAEFKSLPVDTSNKIVEQLRKAIANGDYGQPGDRTFADAYKNLLALEGQLNETRALSAYKRVAGEVEARNVQTRMNMSPAERRATPPWRTQDVPDDQQIIRFGGTQSDSAHNPITAKRVGEMKVDKGFIGNVEHELHIMEAGSPIAKIYGGLSDPQTFKIEWIQDMKGLGANTLGSEKIKQAMKAIKDIYPTVKWIAGERGMGARQGTSKAYETVRVPLR